MCKIWKGACAEESGDLEGILLYSKAAGTSVRVWDRNAWGSFWVGDKPPAGESSLRPASCLKERKYGEAPAQGAEWKRTRGKERGRALPPPGSVTTGRFLPFLGLSTFLCKMKSLEVVDG